MKTNFENVGNFDALFDAQNEKTEQKRDAQDAKEDQLIGLIEQLKRDKKDAKKSLDRSYLDATSDSAGLLMDLEVIDKRLNLNQSLYNNLFGNE